MKNCSKCKRELPYIAFSPDVSQKCGYTSQCKQCRNVAKAKYRLTHKAYYQKYAREHRQEINSRRKSKQKEYYYSAQLYRKKHPEIRQDWAYRVKYSISLEERRQMLDWQDGKCAICRIKENGKKLHVDHCHKTKQIRMLLCRGCNTGNGITDSSTLLRAKAEYLEAYIA